jgi:WD40 repeat protein
MITCVSFSMDGSWVLTGSRDTTIKLWSIKQGKLLNTYRGHTTELINAKISPNKDIIVSCSKDNDLVVWDAKSRSQIMRKTY